MPTDAQRRDALLDELAAIRERHGTVFYFEFTEEQVVELASGYVPNALKAMFRASLDWHDEDQRRADAFAATRARRRGKDAP